MPACCCCCCSGDGGTFADAGNLDHCAKYLNQTLVTFGFPASLDLFATDPVRHARPSPSPLTRSCTSVPQMRQISRGLFLLYQPCHFQAILLILSASLFSWTFGVLVFQLNCGCLYVFFT
jgi:hypothetical protein